MNFILIENVPYLTPAILLGLNQKQQEIWANAHEMCQSLQQFLFAGNLGLSAAVSVQFTLEMCVAAQNREKIH